MLKVDQIHDEATLRQAARLLESENRRLIELVIALREQVAALKGETPASLQQQLALLEQQLATRNAKDFAPSSERRGGGQPEEKPAKPHKGHGPRPQPALPIVEQKHELPESERRCEQCGGALTEMGESEDSEEIDVLERRFVTRKHKRAKYRCACNACIKTAPAPLKLIPGGRYSIGFAIEVAVQKYAYHMPLARIARQMGHDGLVIDTQTLWDQIQQLARVLVKVPRQIKSYVLSQPVIGADETRWPLMTEKEKREGEPSGWYAWGLATPHAAYYAITAGRSTDAAETVIGPYGGVVMADDYAAYESLRARPGYSYKLANCWAHVRRKFVEVESFFPAQCQAVIEMIGELYAIEKRAREGPPEGVLERVRALREKESREVVRRISAWAIATEALPQSGLGRALSYMGDCWKGLLVFLDDPRVPLDNNATERALRGPVVGRKNHYGSRSRRGTEVAALFYTLVESAKLNGLDPRAYLRYATEASLRGEAVQLPHEYVAVTAAGDANADAG